MRFAKGLELPNPPLETIPMAVSAYLDAKKGLACNVVVPALVTVIIIIMAHGFWIRTPGSV